MVARIKEILRCIICLEIVGCPAVQCEAGHLMCGQCRDNLRENTCPICGQPLIAIRNRAVEQVVEALPKECPNAEGGCQELLDADEVDTHRVTCPFRQFSCPHPPCSWTGYKPDIIGHLRDKHPQHVLSSNKQAVQVPVVWNEDSCWTIFFKDDILLLKFCLDQATNILFGSFKCLGSLIPVDTLMFYITVKRGDLKTNVSGSIGPERSATSVQCDDDWDIVFHRNRFDIHTAGRSHSNDFLLVDVEVKDNRREGAGQEDGEVVEQAQPCEARDEAGGLPTVCRVTQKLGSWIGSKDLCLIRQIEPEARLEIHCIITETMANIINVIQKSMDHIASLNISMWFTCLYIENNHLRFFRDFAEKQIKSELRKAALGGSEEWMDFYYRIWGQVVSKTYYENMSKFNASNFHPSVDIVEGELNGLATVRELEFYDERAQRLLWMAHRSGGHYQVMRLIWAVGRYCEKSEEEIINLVKDAIKISWRDITLTA